MEKGYKIQSWKTFKKHNAGMLMYYTYDGVNGRVRDVVQTTMLHHGYQRVADNHGYSLFEDEHPKDMAKRLIDESYLTKEEANNMVFVYYPYIYSGYNSLEDSLYVFGKRIY